MRISWRRIAVVMLAAVFLAVMGFVVYLRLTNFMYCGARDRISNKLVESRNKAFTGGSIEASCKSYRELSAVIREAQTFVSICGGLDQPGGKASLVGIGDDFAKLSAEAKFYQTLIAEKCSAPPP